MENIVTIRRIEERDAESVGKLWYELSLHHEQFHRYYAVRRGSERYLVSHIRDLLNRDCIGFVAEFAGSVVGFVTGYIVKRNPQLEVERVGKVDNIFVLPDFRGDKTGTSLLECLFSYFSDHRVQFIELSCDIQNEDAMRLYKRLGFREQKIMFIKEQ